MTSDRAIPPPRIRPTLRRISMLLVATAAAFACPPSPAAAQARAPTAQMPRLLGLTLDQARAVLERFGSGPPAVRDTVVASATPGIVVRQDPDAGVPLRAPPAVTLWVARTAPGAAVLTGPFLEIAPGAVTMDTPQVVGMPAPSARSEEVAAGPANTLDPPLLARPEAPPTVPAVVGMTLEAARETLAEVGMQVARVEPVPLDPRSTRGLPADGSVLRQLPAAGSPLPTDGSGALWVARWTRSEPTGVGTPNVVGSPVEVAAGTLRQAGLEVGLVVPASSEAPARTVVEQKPRGGEMVPRGTEVALVVSEGPEMRVPEVRGLSADSARSLLAAGGLEPGAVAAVPSSLPPGRVVAQSPAPGTPTEPGARVDLTVAAALPEPETVDVPDVLGALPGAAEAAVRGAGLVPGEVGTVPSGAAEGTVVRQWPPAGTSVAPGAVVRFDLAVPVREPEAPALTVPAVVGLAPDQARGVLTRAGLASVETRGEGDEVADQLPSAGTVVTAGTPVLLTLQATPPPPVASWLSRWRAWGVPAGAVALLLLLRILRARRPTTVDAPPLDPEPAPDRRASDEAQRPTPDYRLGCAPPRGSVQVAGNLLPAFEVTLRPRRPRTVRTEVALAGGLPPDSTHRPLTLDGVDR